MIEHVEQYDGCAVVVIAKTPRAGHSKTRLCPPLSPSRAADLARAFLQDTLETAQALPGAAVTVFHPGYDSDAGLLRHIAPPGVGLMAQRSQGLGPGLAEAAARHFAIGAGSVLLMDSDSPTLPPRYLEQARAALARCDVVIGPCDDGGYYLLGLRAPQPNLFEGISWSTSLVVAETLARAAALGLRVHELPGWYDVDDGRALARLSAELRSVAGHARHTRACLAASAVVEGGSYARYGDHPGP